MITMELPSEYNLNKMPENWCGSALKDESTLHQISPYIGKIKSSMAKTLVSSFSREGDVIYEPFSGSGSVALEAWIAERNIIANDLNPYRQFNNEVQHLGEQTGYPKCLCQKKNMFT